MFLDGAPVHISVILTFGTKRIREREAFTTLSQKGQFNERNIVLVNVRIRFNPGASGSFPQSGIGQPARN